jgi:hypothetical protein
MVKRLGILLLTIFVILILTVTGRTEEMPREGLLRDGFAINGVDGRINGRIGEGWFFELDSDVIDDKIVAKKGTNIQILPSATLQRILDDMKIRHSDNYCIWGRATKYKGKNFIFPIYFLPLSKIEKPKPETPQAPPEPNAQEQEPPGIPEPNINEPNDILAIPQEIIEKIKTKRLELTKLQDTDAAILDQASVEKLNRTHRQDTVLADRTAFLDKQDGQLVFTLDALGRSVPKISLQLLPCEALELTERKQSAALEQPKFKIAGIMTEYQGQNYLLLQKATTVYNYGNFAR